MSAIGAVCERAAIDEWGAAANRGWPLAPAYPFAIALVGRHAPAALAGLETSHMSAAFFDDYSRLFAELDAAAAAATRLIAAHGYRAQRS